MFQGGLIGTFGRPFDPNQLVSGNITSGDFAPDSVNSGDIASGTVGSVHLRDGTILTIDIASGQIQSGQIGSGSVAGFFGPTRHTMSGTFGVTDFGSGAVIAGTVGSGAIQSGNYSSGSIGTFHVASGQFTGFELGSGSIVSGRIASGQVGNFHIASGQVQGLAGAGVPNLASGTVNAFNLGSGSVLSGHIGSGSVWGLVGSLPHILSGSMTGFELGSGSVVSGRIASGQIADNHFASGARIDSCEWTMDDSLLSADNISGGGVAVGVCLTQSGTLLTAAASISGRMPAIGVAIANFASGVAVTLYRHGRVFSANFNFSGWMNRPLYVGRSGQIIASGAPTSSGDIQQIVGFSLQQSGAMLQFGDPLEQAIAASGDIGSGAVYGQAAAGYFTIASGSITTNDLGSGAIVSGLISSGVIGRFHIASGQLAGFELGSGAIVSGRVASGQIGNFHIASGQVQGLAGAGVPNVASGTINANNLGSGSVLSGHVASGQIGRYHLSSGTVIDLIPCEATLSGVRAVAWGSGGCFVVPAERTSGLRSPAIGVVAGNFVSGDIVPVVRRGLVLTASSGAIASGFFGRFLYVGSGGLIINQSGFMGGASSGEGAAPTAAASGYSGALVQRIGVAVSGGIDVFVDTHITSGLISGHLVQY